MIKFVSCVPKDNSNHQDKDDNIEDQDGKSWHLRGITGMIGTTDERGETHILSSVTTFKVFSVIKLCVSREVYECTKYWLQELTLDYFIINFVSTIEILKQKGQCVATSQFSSHT